MWDDDALEHNPNVHRHELESLHEGLFAWCLSRAAYDRPAAEDLMQQAYVEILSGKARFDGHSSLKTFLFGVVQLLARSHYRKLASRMRLSSRVAEESVQPDYPGFGDDHRSRRVWEAVQALPARQRDMTELVFCREMTIEEASSVMRISLGAGRTHYDRAKRALAKALADLDSIDERETRRG